MLRLARIVVIPLMLFVLSVVIGLILRELCIRP